MGRFKKNTIPTILTWLTLAVSTCAIGIHFVSCSRDISSIVQDQQSDSEIAEVIAAISQMPPIVEEYETAPASLKSKKGGISDSILIYNRPIVPPGSVDNDRIIKSHGGEISLHYNDRVVGSLEIPPNAISKDTTIQISSYWLLPLGLDVREYHFSPDGLQFSEKANLKLAGSMFKNSDNTPAEEILWLYLNPSTNRWVLQNIVTKGIDGYFHIEMSHFSIYRAATKSSAGVSQGGQVKPNDK